MANILAVDDNPDLCILLKTALERDGHRVVTCSSGADLTEALCRWSDCILLDVMMPNESGFAGLPPDPGADGCTHFVPDGPDR